MGQMNSSLYDSFVSNIDNVNVMIEIDVRITSRQRSKFVPILLLEVSLKLLHSCILLLLWFPINSFLQSWTKILLRLLKFKSDTPKTLSTFVSRNFTRILKYYRKVSR